MSNSLHTYPCLQDRTNGRSPVREKYTYTYPCLQDRTNGRSPVREKYTYTPIPAYRTAQMADRRSGKNTHTHLSLPTGPHKWQIAGQGKIHTHTYPCLQDRTNGRSPVREKYTYTPIPVYRTAQMADRRSGENTHTHLSLPTGPHKWQIAGQGEIHTLVTMSCCCRHALYTYTCTLYLRVPRTVGSHFSFCKSRGSGKLDTTMILSSLCDRMNRPRVTGSVIIGQGLL